MIGFTLAYAVMYGLWGAATEKSGCAEKASFFVAVRDVCPVGFAVRRGQWRNAFTYIIMGACPCHNSTSPVRSR